jgi:ATP-binding cassette subfamily B protein/subfamily B ATP-binding cassette protein MsbA
VQRYRILLRYPLRRWPGFVAIAVVTLASTAAAALEPWPLKILVDSALGDASAPRFISTILDALSLEPTRETLVVAAALAGLGVFALASILNLLVAWLWSSAGHAMVYDLAANLFARFERLDPDRHSVGDALTRISGDSWAINTVAEGLVNAPLRYGLTIVTVGVVAWRLDSGLALISLLIAPILAASTLYFTRRTRVVAELGRRNQSELFSSVHQAVSSIALVQAFDSAARNSTRFGNIAADAVRLFRRRKVLDGLFGLMSALVTTVGTAVVLYVGALQILDGSMTVGSLLVFLAYLKLLQAAAQGLFSTYYKVQTSRPQLDRVLEVLEAEEPVQDAADAEALPMLGGRGGGHVVFEDVSFGYDPERLVLENVSLEVHPGETAALVGPTGAGKSTLVSLILRFFDPTSGTVRINGADLRRVRLSSLRNAVAIVLQEPFLLPLSVADNIAYGHPEASREQIEAAARVANADGFIGRLPEGYDTVIGERGATLSGGEKQRIAIARALLRDAPILILDEPTSALDSRTEGELLEALDRLMEGRTTFIIAHRLSTIRKADRIFVLDRGRLVESGTHTELVEQKGLYDHLQSAQSLEGKSASV